MEDDHLGGAYLMYPVKMRPRVCEREWKEFKEVMSKIPFYLLRYLKIHDDESMTLRPADPHYRQGKQLFIEDITNEGANIFIDLQWTIRPRLPSHRIQLGCFCQ